MKRETTLLLFANFQFNFNFFFLGLNQLFVNCFIVKNLIKERDLFQHGDIILISHTEPKFFSDLAQSIYRYSLPIDDRQGEKESDEEKERKWDERSQISD